MRVLPILFNTDMVRGILDGRKTVTRRVINPQPSGYFETNDNPLYIYDVDDGLGRRTPPYQPGDILYVRETWNYGYIETSDIPESSETWFESVRPDGECGEYIKALSHYFYKADEDAPGKEVEMIWRTSIHMPKKAARIWLKVTDVRVERLQECGKGWCLKIEKEGVVAPQDPILYINDDKFHDALREEFKNLWNSTIKKSDLDRYGWDANPWVWVIEFKRCEKPEEEK